MKLVTRLLILFLYLSGLVYLALPQPEVVVLPNALRSTEPGDTWQNQINPPITLTLVEAKF